MTKLNVCGSQYNLYSGFKVDSSCIIVHHKCMRCPKPFFPPLFETLEDLWFNRMQEEVAQSGNTSGMAEYFFLPNLD